MLNAIQEYQEKEGLRSMVVSDDGTIVIFKKQYDQDTGVEKPEEVEKSFRKEEIQKEIDRLQGEIDTLNSFLEDPKVASIEIKPVEEPVIIK